MSDKEFKVIKLEQENYAVWKWQFVNVLKAKKLDSVLTQEIKPEEDSQALALLGSALSSENQRQVDERFVCPRSGTKPFFYLSSSKRWSNSCWLQRFSQVLQE